MTAIELLHLRLLDINPNHFEASVRELSSVADNFKWQDKLVEAENSYRQALVIQKELSGYEHVQVVSLLNTLAEVLQKQGKSNESEATYREALSIQRKVSGDNHPDVAAFLFKLAERFWNFRNGIG